MFVSSIIGPPALTVNIIKNIERSSIVVQWDAVDDFFHTTYTITWSDERDLHGVDTVDVQTSYTITGLTLDTVYTITVTAGNRCGSGPEFRTSVSLSTDITSTTLSISPTVTASTNPVTTMLTTSSTTITSRIIANSTTINTVVTTVGRNDDTSTKAPAVTTLITITPTTEFLCYSTITITTTAMADPNASTYILKYNCSMLFQPEEIITQ